MRKVRIFLSLLLFCSATACGPAYGRGGWPWDGAYGPGFVGPLSFRDHFHDDHFHADGFHADHFHGGGFHGGGFHGDHFHGGGFHGGGFHGGFHGGGHR